MTPPNPKQAFGAQKPDLSLNPPVAGHHMALAMEEGARKYGPFNWRKDPVEARTYVAAALRHLLDWADGTERSSDADVHNLGHAMACCAILLDAQEQGTLIDNRPTAGKSAEVLERLKAWKIERAKMVNASPAEPEPTLSALVSYRAHIKDTYGRGLLVDSNGIAWYFDGDRPHARVHGVVIGDPPNYLRVYLSTSTHADDYELVLGADPNEACQWLGAIEEHGAPGLTSIPDGLE